MTIIGWIFIVVGSLGILKDLVPLATSGLSQGLAALKAQGIGDIGPAWTTRFLGVVGGVAVLYALNWGRWLLVAWMAFHIGISVLHSPMEVLMHTVIFAPITYFLFRPEAAQYFRGSAG
jgi:hypothetical protein